MNKFDWHSEPALARPISANPNNGEVYWDQRGISAWDYFAAAALPAVTDFQTLVSKNGAQRIAIWAANVADAMMLERAKRSTDAHAEWQESIKPHDEGAPR